jgi:hypothetical protein
VGSGIVLSADTMIEHQWTTDSIRDSSRDTWWHYSEISYPDFFLLDLYR